jgi:hypothetical protein
MAFTTPGTAVAGEVLTAAFWNTNVRDNTNALRAVQINVKSATNAGLVTATSGTEATVATVTITPSSATSNILIFATGQYKPVHVANSYARLLVYRSTTQLFLTDTGINAGTDNEFTISSMFLDSPTSASELTYTLRMNRASASTGNVTCAANKGRIIVMEIAA